MSEQMEPGSGQSKLPLLVSMAAAAAAGTIAVVARKALSGRGGGEGDGEGGEGERTRLDDVEQVADELDGLVGALRSEFKGPGDYQRLTEIADTISEYADQAADAFSRASSGEDESAGPRVTDELMSRISEIRGESGDVEGSESDQKVPA